MAVIEYDEYKQKLQALEPTLQELEKALSIPKAREELAQLQKETEQEGFWSDVDRSQKVSQQIKRLESKVKKYDRLVSDWEDTLTLCEMAQEEDDASQLPEVTSGYETLEKEINERRLAALLDHAAAAAVGAGDVHVGEELHVQRYLPGAVTGRAAQGPGVVRERPGLQPLLLGLG